MTDKYILDGKVAIPCQNLEEWAIWLGKADRHVAVTEIGNVHISTVFLGLDHRFTGEGPPLIFETMIFGGEHGQYQTRSSTWDEAESHHQKAVDLAKPKK